MELPGAVAALQSGFSRCHLEEPENKTDTARNLGFNKRENFNRIWTIDEKELAAEINKYTH